MAKKKSEIEEIEDEILEDDEQDDAEDSEKDKEDDSSEEDKSKVDKKAGSDSEDDSDDDDESEGKEVDEELEEKRARRRREKKMRRERDKRERAMMEKTIITMADEIKKLKDGHGEVTKRFDGLTIHQIDSEIKELGTIYQQAQAAMESAVADGDGKRFTQAKAISDKAWARYTFLEAQKRQRPNPTSDDRQERSTRADSRTEKNDSADGASEEGVQLGPEGKRLGIAFVNRHKSWYDPNGQNRESKVVQTIDADLYSEGYDPETKEYWDELEDRCKEMLPHRFKAAGNKPKPKSIVGGSNNDFSPANAEKSLPKEFVQTLKAAGYWEDPVKRKAAIKDFWNNKRKGA